MLQRTATSQCQLWMVILNSVSVDKMTSIKANTLTTIPIIFNVIYVPVIAHLDLDKMELVHIERNRPKAS